MVNSIIFIDFNVFVLLWHTIKHVVTVIAINVSDNKEAVHSMS